MNFLVDDLEYEHMVHEADKVGFENSFYMAGTVLFNNTDSSSGTFLSCGLTDKWENLVLYTNGAYALSRSFPTVAILPHVDDSQMISYATNNITKNLLRFEDLYYNSNVSYVLTFTLGKKLENNNSSYEVKHNKIILGYYRPDDTLIITQSFYSTKKTLFEFEYSDNVTNATAYQTTNPIKKWGIHLIPLVLDIKVSRFVYTVLSETLGINVKGYDELKFNYQGRIRYDVTSIVKAVIYAILVFLALFFITKLILYKCPQGIPTYYGLLHEYHKNRLDASPPYDAEIERESIFNIIDKTYEGVGYDGRLQRNRVGVLDEASIRVGTNKNGVIKRRFIR
ncbi:uncharacterized protein SAPINGB_P002368 [Magnusiomyces paraingens]|uniref:Uncharacterized protein n=1 Tax=Magnusiomyces paraingens TaxID=2606893 RepID=A0A5E8BJD6_9ASCO|nr:uncharacterized protein SAPINGB_P002368 [Saprochaete ingens]VVT49637.1 unnamed protein product [Saprochaete ingens]